MGTLLLDVRNYYETRIGCFQAVRLCWSIQQESPHSWQEQKARR